MWLPMFLEKLGSAWGNNLNSLSGIVYVCIWCLRLSKIGIKSMLLCGDSRLMLTCQYQQFTSILLLASVITSHHHVLGGNFFLLSLLVAHHLHSDICLLLIWSTFTRCYPLTPQFEGVSSPAYAALTCDKGNLFDSDGKKYAFRHFRFLPDNCI